MDSSVVLLSSGLDSTVNLYEAHKQTNVLLVLTFDYGQKSAKRELEQAAKICKTLRIEHKTLTLGFFKDFTHTSLVSLKHEIPKNVELDNASATTKSATAVWVPNRNGIFLNIAAGFAEGLGAQVVIPGFNIEEAQTFPDNTQNYLNAVTHSFSLSTSNQIQAKCFTTQLNKREIVKRGIELQVDFNLIWPCYNGAENICKVCESCARFLRAIDGLVRI